jgi:hypothetical protein
MTDKPTYRDRLNQIAAALDKLHEQADALRAQMADLEAQGIIDAAEHWRKDRDGQKTILELVYSVHSDRVTQEGKRRIEYIGNSPEKIEAARAGMQRFEQYLKLKAELRQVEGVLLIQESSIDTMLYRLKNEQTRLPGV